MNQSLGGFRAALWIGWLVLSAAGWSYARVKDIPAWVAVPVLAAFLLEYPFYLLPGFASARARLQDRYLAPVLIASALAPYLVYGIPTGQFHWFALVRLAALAIALSLWYAVFAPGTAADLLFLLLPACALLGKYFEPIYTAPIAGLRVEILGHLALIHLCAAVMLIERRVTGVGFGFLPTRSDWRIGLLHFVLMLPIVLALGLVLGVVHIGPFQPWWKIAGTFFGVLWVVALSEELFFRGLLQQWLEHWSGSAELALALAAALFGLVHLGYHGFPNWRFALLAGIAGVFYGRAYRQAGSIRASMVAHALIVTTWRTLLS